MAPLVPTCRPPITCAERKRRADIYGYERQLRIYWTLVDSRERVNFM